MSMTRVGRNDEDRRPRLQTEIAALWDRIADLGDRISEEQLAFLMRSEPDDDAPALTLSIWRMTLARAVAEPGNIGVNWDALNPTAICRCDGGGLVYDSTTKHPGWRPCERCHERQYRWWNDHHRDPQHSCSDCTGGRRRRESPTAEREDRDEDREQIRTQREQDELDGLR
jgi:hypothetical protein